MLCYQNCIGTNEQPTHERVEQNVVVVPATETATALYNLLREEFDRHPYNYKIIGKSKVHEPAPSRGKPFGSIANQKNKSITVLL